jgi:hypothetical protein
MCENYPLQLESVGRLKVTQDMVVGWLPRIANSPFQRWKYPRIASWVILSRPYGTVRWHRLTQDYVLGYSQPSLRD